MTQVVIPYRWKLSEGYPAPGIKYHGAKVFGTFVCGGGSTMGYKLAGFDHLGGVEIDPKVASVYQANHAPRFLYVEDIRRFNDRNDLPEELFGLDLLDGSPPCSSFSSLGSRERGWGRKKQFREGQVEQQLDDLVFSYVETIEKLRPKVAILENVKGLVMGNAKAYSGKIVHRLNAAGYVVQVFLVNASSMGVPQNRERVFFVARQDKDLPELKLSFSAPKIPFRDIHDSSARRKPLSEGYRKRWATCRVGHQPKTKNGGFGFMTRCSFTKVLPTVTAGVVLALPDSPEELSREEYTLAGSFPVDFDFLDMSPKYLIGMSVPPVMTAQIAHQIRVQWLSGK